VTSPCDSLIWSILRANAHFSVEKLLDSVASGRHKDTSGGSSSPTSSTSRTWLETLRRLQSERASAASAPRSRSISEKHPLSAAPLSGRMPAPSGESSSKRTASPQASGLRSSMQSSGSMPRRSRRPAACSGAVRPCQQSPHVSDCQQPAGRQQRQLQPSACATRAQCDSGNCSATRHSEADVTGKTSSFSTTTSGSPASGCGSASTKVIRRSSSPLSHVPQLSSNAAEPDSESEGIRTVGSHGSSAGQRTQGHGHRRREPRVHRGSVSWRTAFHVVAPYSQKAAPVFGVTKPLHSCARTAIRPCVRLCTGIASASQQ